MKFLKSQNTSRYSPSDNTFQVNSYGRAVMDIRGAVMVPKGTTDERPDFYTGMRHPGAGETLSTKIPNGYLRFNTDLDAFEGYINGTWEIIRSPGASAIAKQTLGPGNSSDTIFGPLLSDPRYLNAYSASPDTIIILVENVMQISTTNFTLTQNPTSVGTGEEIVATSMVDGTEYIITSLGITDFTLVGAGWQTAGSFTVGVTYTIKTIGTTDYTAIGAASNTVGITFTATDVGTGDGKALPSTYTQSTGDVFTYDDSNSSAAGDGEVRETGYYIEFTSSVPSSKYITVYYGFSD